jgi:hypothetical protein
MLSIQSYLCLNYVTIALALLVLRRDKSQDLGEGLESMILPSLYFELRTLCNLSSQLIPFSFDALPSLYYMLMLSSALFSVQNVKSSSSSASVLVGPPAPPYVT